MKTLQANANSLTKRNEELNFSSVERRKRNNVINFGKNEVLLKPSKSNLISLLESSRLKKISKLVTPEQVKESKENYLLTEILNKKVKSGDLRYIKFQKFLNSHESLNIKSAMFLVNSDVASKKDHSRNDFKTGKLNITNLTKLNSYVRAIDKSKKFFKNYNDIKFLKAFVALWNIPQYNHYKMMKRLSLKVVLPKIGEPRIKEQKSVDGYKKMLLDLYNYHVPEKTKIMFNS